MAQRNRRRQRRRGGIGAKLALLGGTLFVVLVFGVFAIASWVLNVAADAPSLAACKQVNHTGNSAIYAGDGSKLGLISSDEARDPVSIERIPKQLQLATVAIEDQRFYEHGGVDPEGILRAAVKNLEAGKTVEGGSTITQQLVRHLCLRNPKRDLERKIIEAKLAIEYAERHSRKEILDQYLNTATYGTVEGATTVGVGAASQIYFSKPVWKLSLEQSALLAGLPQAPSEYNPILHPGEARQRRNSVLAKMAHLGYLSPARARQAEESGLGLDVSGSYFAHREPFFFDYVEHQLIERYGAQIVRDGGIKAYTTLQPRLQEVGLEAMRSALPYSTDPSSALVSIDPDNGEIESMVSSSNYDSSQFNLAAQGHRQPGSTFKAFVLTTAIKQGIDPYTTYYVSKPLDLDLPKWGHWEVHTADEGYLGKVNLQQATVASDNTVFAQLDLDVGPERVAATAKSMGITSPLDGIPAEGIGGLRVGVSPLELADAYATLADGGVHHDPVAIKRVVFPGGKTERPNRAAPRRVISEAVAYEVTRLLHDNITEGTGTAAYTGCPGQAGKTGTTDRETDAWFAGYQPNLTTVVWVGYPQSNAIEMTDVHGITVFGGTFPAEIWHSLYSGAEIPCEEFDKPKQPISWAPYFGHFTASAPRGKGTGGPGGAAEAEADRAREIGEEVTGGYNPDAYAPGAGQKPTPVPPPPPATNVGGGGAAEEVGSK
ncbi:MAG TPA: transglycosylase domain-containing protein [Solirubrobacterales bacterium]|jgi:penicillin-binding protein 1A|nr:transglycosylase domain-containing protein [Solirubrobacterales bacterium]